MRPFSILGTWVISCHATSYIPHFKHPPRPIYPQFYTFDILTNRRPVFAASSMMTVCHFYIWSEGGNRRLGVGLVVAGTCGHQGKGGSWPEPEIPAASCQHTFILMLNCLSVRSALVKSSHRYHRLLADSSSNLYSPQSAIVTNEPRHTSRAPWAVTCHVASCFYKLTFK